MSFSPLAYADSLRIGSIDFVSPDEIKVLLDIEAPDNLAIPVGRSNSPTFGHFKIPHPEGRVTVQ